MSESISALSRRPRTGGGQRSHRPRERDLQAPLSKARLINRRAGAVARAGREALPIVCSGAWEEGQAMATPRLALVTIVSLHRLSWLGDPRRGRRRPLLFPFVSDRPLNRHRRARRRGAVQRGPCRVGGARGPLEPLGDRRFGGSRRRRRVLSRFTDRIDLLTLGGEAVRWIGVALYTMGGVLRLAPVFVLGAASAALSQSSRTTGWPPRGFMASSVIRAILASSSRRSAGAWRSAPAPASPSPR